jgi:O-antigen/teichoic acid export membrane protein
VKSGSAIGGPRTGLGAVLSGGGLAFFLASSVANASNFLFHVLMSRLLGPNAYGALGSLLGAITVVTFAAGALQAAVIQVAARVGHDGAPALRRHSGLALVAGMGALAVSWALAAPLESFLHLRSALPVVLLGAFGAMSLMAVVPQGVLLGRLSFSVVATALVAGAVVRVGAAVAFVEVGLGLDGALAATALSAGVILGVLAWPLRHELMRRGDHLRIHIGPASLAVGAVGGFSALVGVDTFLARHYLSATTAGSYAAAATAARIALFMPAALALVAFPRLSASGGRGPGARRVLLHASASVAALSGAAAVVMVAAPHTVISLLFGPRYQPAAGALRILAVAAAALGLASLLVYAQVAKGHRRALVPWAGVAGAAACIGAFHSSMVLLASTMLGVTVVTLVLLWWGAWPSADPPADGADPPEGATRTASQLTAV